MPRSEQFDCRSAAGRSYRIFLAWPAEEPPPAGFPVIYLLDANAAFGTMVEAVRMQSRHPPATGVEPAVVVGIGYPVEEPFDIVRRTYDLTPPLPAGQPVPIGDPTGGRAVGGAADMLDFIAAELMPEIEGRLAVDPSRRAIFGHSFGGLFVLHALFSQPGLFSTYAAASPSIWWRGRAILDEEEAFGRRRDHIRPGTRLVMTVGALEQVPGQAGGDGPSAPDRSARRMIDNARELAGRLAALAPGRLDVHFSVLPDETHASSLPVAISRSLRLICADREA